MSSMKISTTQWAASLGLLGFAWTTAVACGTEQPESKVEQDGGSSTGASSSGGSHNGIGGTLILNSGGEDGLGNNNAGGDANGFTQIPLLQGTGGVTWSMTPNSMMILSL